MNTRIHLALGAGVLALILSLGAAHAAGVDPSGGLTGPWLIGAGTQEDQIVSALKDANYAKAVAARTFDLTVIRAHFADDASVPLTSRQIAELARMAPGTSPSGVLTYELAYFGAWRVGAEAFQRVQTARRAGKLPDPRDVLAAIPPRADPIRDLPLTVHLVRVSGDRAYVEAETEAQYFRVTLALHGTQWVIVGENNTSKLGS